MPPEDAAEEVAAEPEGEGTDAEAEESQTGDDVVDEHDDAADGTDAGSEAATSEEA